ncbi:MAG TPA: DUF1684 domain-containing protein [Roseiflexaceae bacterium]|nr:DUF1684 domain-containing protein [Roseiflexaceae bacterium]
MTHFTTTDTYIADIIAWREHVEATLRADDGWLTVAGLFWLDEGENKAGADPSLPVALPADSAPALIGSFWRSGRRVVLQPAADVDLQINGKPATQHELRSDAGGTGTPDLVTIGALTIFVIERGDRIGLRLRDRNSLARRTFRGRQWFSIDPAYRLTARFVPYEPPKPLTITSILGDTSETTSPGALHFTLDGQALALDTTRSGERLSIVFRDLTAGHETYGAARFLTTSLPVNGLVELDFNRAVNPPCAFTEYATCPLPSPQNRLPVRIPAGETYQGNH